MKNQTKPNDTANPVSSSLIDAISNGHYNSPYATNYTGLTKREEFAKAALQSYISSAVTQEETLLSKIKRLLGIKGWSVMNNYNKYANAKAAVEAADALIEALNRDPQS